MNPSCKLPCYMNSSNSKMLQIPLAQQLPAPKFYKLHQKVANSMESDRFQLQDFAKTVDMAASSSKMLHRARKTCRKNGSQKRIQNGKNIIPKTIPDPFIIGFKHHLRGTLRIQLATSNPMVSFRFSLK